MPSCHSPPEERPFVGASVTTFNLPLFTKAVSSVSCFYVAYGVAQLFLLLFCFIHAVLNEHFWFGIKSELFYMSSDNGVMILNLTTIN